MIEASLPTCDRLHDDRPDRPDDLDHRHDRKVSTQSPQLGLGAFHSNQVDTRALVAGPADLTGVVGSPERADHEPAVLDRGDLSADLLDDADVLMAHRGRITGTRSSFLGRSLRTCSDVHARQNTLPSGFSMTTWSRTPHHNLPGTTGAPRATCSGTLARISRSRRAMSHGLSPAPRMSIWSRFFADFPLAPAAIQSQEPCPRGR